jgi:DNA-binding transcriptional MerR regulator
LAAAEPTVFYSSPVLTLACLAPSPNAGHFIDHVAARTGVHPETLRYYCRMGLLDAQIVGMSGGVFFTDDVFEEVVRIEHYRRHLGVCRKALPLICQLRRDAERLELKLAFLLGDDQELPESGS